MNTSRTVTCEKSQLFFIVALAVAAMLLAGCVLSVEPAIPESEAIYDARLTGSWEMIDGSDRATIIGDGAEYSVEYTEGPGPMGAEEATRTFGGRLGLLGERMFLELWPVHNDETAHGGMLLPAYLLFQIEIGEEEIAVASIETHAMSAALERGELHLAYSGGTDDAPFLLRASSGELRSALGSYLQTPGALAEAGRWRRVATVQPVGTN
jgi:hypothetical protein